jgi:signal transduction histidine kinase
VSTVAARLPAALARLSRRRDGALLGGVCSGLAHSARVDPTLVRLVFALLSFVYGAGVVAYAAAWVGLPEEGGKTPSRAARIIAVVMLGAAAVLALRAVGFGDSVIWPAAIVTVGVFLALWRTPGSGRPRGTSRAIVAASLVVVGALLFLDLAGDNEQGLIAPAGLVVALFLVVGPWVWRLARERDAERLERIRVEERADMAARIHDSVLQTLALVQREADDPKRVAALARRQERELRSWLYGDPDAPGDTLRRALEEQLTDVEELHGVRVEIVQSGDRPLDEHLHALVLAAREAVANAAVHAGVDEVSVYVDVGPSEVTAYVRDRGSGFDRDAVPADRRGLAESIEARMTRHGGTAAVRSTPGEGTEIELRLPLEAE